MSTANNNCFVALTATANRGAVAMKIEAQPQSSPFGQTINVSVTPSIAREYAQILLSAADAADAQMPPLDAPT